MPIIDTYLAQTKQLLQLPEPPASLYNDTDLVAWINRARVQLAGEAECIRRIGEISTVADQREYDFADIDLGDSTDTGIAGPINVRRINYEVGDGQKQLYARPWEWFDLYCLNTVTPVASQPVRWAQYGQGGAPGSSGSDSGGSFYLDPPPDGVYVLRPDCVCYPVDLDQTDESPPEPIPVFWIDAICYYAAYLALSSAQASARTDDAARYFNQYGIFVERARRFSNPSLLRPQYPQAVDPAQINKLSVRPTGGGGAAQ